MPLHFTAARHRITLPGAADSQWDARQTTQFSRKVSSKLRRRCVSASLLTHPLMMGFTTGSPGMLA